MPHKCVEYIVIRTRDVLGYRELFGPVVSNAREIMADAHRLYAKEGYTLSWVPKSAASRAMLSELGVREPVRPCHASGSFACMRGEHIFTLKEVPAHLYQARWRWAIYRDGDRVGFAKTKKEAQSRIDSGCYDH